jgi:hypothetical protein
MKYNRLIFISMIACLQLLSGCDKIVYINIDEGDRKIVLSGLINPDSTVVVHFSRTRQISTTGPRDSTELLADSLKPDFIRLYENDLLVGDLMYRWKNFYELPGFYPSPGKTYRIESSAGEMDPVMAVIQIPEKIPILDFDTAHVITENQVKAVRIHFSFQDPAGQENYYALQVSGLQRYYDHLHETFLDDSLYAYSYPTNFLFRTDGGLFDELIEANKVYYMNNIFAHPVVFTDEYFSGRKIEITLTYPENMYTRMDIKVLFRVDLMHIDKSFYQYAVSETKHREARGNPFTELVPVYTNIQNGYGLFSAYNVDSREFLLDREKW